MLHNAVVFADRWFCDTVAPQTTSCTDTASELCAARILRHGPSPSMSTAGEAHGYAVATL